MVKAVRAAINLKVVVTIESSRADTRPIQADPEAAAAVARAAKTEVLRAALAAADKGKGKGSNGSDALRSPSDSYEKATAVVVIITTVRCQTLLAQTAAPLRARETVSLELGAEVYLRLARTRPAPTHTVAVASRLP